MTDSNIQPPDTGAGIPDSVVPGTDVTYTTPAGLYPEDTTGDINIDTTVGDQTFTVSPDNNDFMGNVALGESYADAVDFHVDNMPPATHAPHPEIIQKLDHVLEHLHQLDARVNDLHHRLDQEQATDHGPEVPPTYEGHVVLHATHMPQG